MILSKTVFDLNTFEDVKIGIDYTPTPAFTSLEEAMSFFGNDETKVLEALNSIKTETEQREVLATTPLTEFHNFANEEETELNGPANVQVADDKTVNDLILSLAKQHYGFSKDASREEKQKAKTAAREFIKGNDALRNALVVMSAAKLGQ
jgi:hypothetical protein